MKQIVVIVDNHPGIVADLAHVLGERGINIETLEADGADEHGAIVLTVDLYDEALTTLRDAGFQAVSEDAIVIRLDDEPGALAKIAARFKNAKINLRSIRIIKRHAGFSLVALVADRNDEAMALVKDVAIGAG